MEENLSSQLYEILDQMTCIPEADGTAKDFYYDEITSNIFYYLRCCLQEELGCEEV
jgi:hypothetical protein